MAEAAAAGGHDAEEESVTVVRGPEESLGLRLSETQILLGVDEGSPAERAGVSRVLGMQLFELAGLAVNDTESLVVAAGSAGTECVLRFRRAPADGHAATPDGSENPELEHMLKTMPQMPQSRVSTGGDAGRPGVKRGLQQEYSAAQQDPGLAPFLEMPHAVYAQACSKINHKKTAQPRVLVLTKLNVFLCTKGSDVKRLLKYGQIEQVLIRNSAGGKKGPVTEMLWKLASPEHDLLLRLPGGEADVGSLLPIMTQAREALTGEQLDVKYVDDDLFPSASLVKSKLWSHPHEVLQQCAASPANTHSILAGVEPDPIPPTDEERAALTAVAKREKELQAWDSELSARERDAEEVEATVRQRDEAVGSEDFMAHIPPRLSSRRQRTLSEVSMASPSPRRTAPASPSHMMGSVSPSFASRSPQRLASFSPSGAVPPLPPEAYDTKHARAGVSFWRSESFRPSPCPSSGLPLVAQTAPAAGRDLAPQEVDFWVRFVQRWEADGVTTVMRI
eukprot:TRINITY_DN20781_c0_g1_i1.p1 TRINITY_DN20781_c0_g1~~TRINITY_DN20781_c0_g1_i1.p1  ORF type:complete len:524 (+),score=137.21 TRINITY_DN20781_c0_g1_i1:56-1573(+)